MRKSKLLLVSWILSVLYCVMLIASLGGMYGSSDSYNQAASVFLTILLYPHMIVVFLGLLFNILGWSLNKAGYALTGAILYTVGIVLMPVYIFFILIQTILSRSEEHTSELQSRPHLVCRLLLEKKKKKINNTKRHRDTTHS